MKQGVLMVISGPSGCGKGTLCSALLARCPQIRLSVSATTRAPRPGELDGVHYYFMSKEAFGALREANGFLEWAPVYEDYYGTPAGAVQDMLDQGFDVILEIDVQGGLQIKEKYPEAVLVFVTTVSKGELAQRLVGRNTETAEKIKMRLDWAAGEMQKAQYYDYIVVNDELEKAVQALYCIVQAEKCRAHRVVLAGWA